MGKFSRAASLGRRPRRIKFPDMCYLTGLAFGMQFLSLWYLILIEYVLGGPQSAPSSRPSKRRRMYPRIQRRRRAVTALYPAGFHFILEAKLNDLEKAGEILRSHVNTLQRETDRLLSLTIELPPDCRWEFEKVLLSVSNVLSAMRQDINGISAFRVRPE